MVKGDPMGVYVSRIPRENQVISRIAQLLFGPIPVGGNQEFCRSYTSLNSTAHARVVTPVQPCKQMYFFNLSYSDIPNSSN